MSDDQPVAEPEPEPEPVSDEPATPPQTEGHANGQVIDSPTVNAEVVGVTILAEGPPPEPEPEPASEG